MDVEGTDGRERGEDQDFERKSALFSLAGTEVLLVNLWYVRCWDRSGVGCGALEGSSCDGCTMLDWVFVGNIRLGCIKERIWAC